MDPIIQLLIANIGAVFAAFGGAFGLYLKLNSQVKSSELRLRDEIQSVRSEMKGDMESLRSEMKGDMESLRSEMKGDIKELRGEIKELGLRIQAVEVSVGGLNHNLEMIRSLLGPTMQESVRTALLQD